MKGEIINMPRPMKLVENTTGNFTKEQILAKKRVEKELYKFDREQLSTPPPHLDEIATAEYKRVLPLLNELPICNLDLAQITAYCEFYSDFVKASKQCREHGLFINDSKGELKTNPAFKVKESASLRMERVASTLGLTMDSRYKISSKKQEQEVIDPFAQFGN